MKVNFKKFGAIVAGATILASSAAFAAVTFGSTTLVDDSGAPLAKVALGSNSAPSDAVVASMIAGKLAGSAYKSETLTASVSGSATCSGDGDGDSSGTCSISSEKARLEITVPGSVAAGTWTGDNLIGDFLNRELFDREPNDDNTDSDQAYENGGSDTSENANPFTDGTGGDIGVSQEFMYNIDGGMFSPFADATVTDTDSGNTYVEMQNLWVKGDNHFDKDPDDVVGDLDFIAYTLKFDGPGGEELGIPVCTESEDNDFTFCKGVDGDIDDATETHRVKVWFLGEEWIISEMNAPTPSDVTNENVIVNGGSVKLAKESVGGILNQGEFLQVDDLKFQLDDLEAHGDTTSAILSVLDANDNILEKDKVDPGDTKEMNVNGKEYRFHVYKVAPGYTFGAKWADVAIFSHEIECEDGQDLDSDENTNPHYECALGWKNMDAEADLGGTPGDEATPDTLRTMVIYTDDVEDVSSSGESELEAGDYVSLVEEPTAWKLSYKGLDLASEDRYNLKFEIKTSDKEISASKGPYTSCDDGSMPTFYPTTCGGGANPVQAKCVIYAPYIEVSSGATGSVFEVDRSDVGGDLSDNEFYVALSADPGNPTGAVFAATCDATNSGEAADDFPNQFQSVGAGDDLGLHQGTVFMKLSSSSNDYGILDYVDSSNANFGTGGTTKSDVGTEVRYEDIGDGDHDFAPPDGGVIVIEGTSFSASGYNGVGDDVAASGEENQIEDLLQSLAPGSGTAGWNSGTPELLFAIAEKAGTGSSSEFVNYWVFGVDDSDAGPSDATFDFNSEHHDGTQVTSDDEEILYGHAVSNPGAGDSCAFGATEFYCGPEVSGPIDSNMQLVEEGYISERGSVFDMIDDNTVEFDMAHRLIRAQWWLGPSETSSASDSTTVVTLGEGESTTVGGVTVKVLEITEDVGACSAAGGAVSCTADMSGVSAVVMPNNAPSVEVAVPYSGNYGNLVVLDTDAAGLNTVIAVGGDAVNSVSSELLASSPVDWTTETTVVREVTAGKIVVAGAEASDTMQAGKDFLAQLQNA
ncbi:MAG: hypothetical protein ABH983_05500 [Candidatus Micrarchaeota archaeon]